MRKYATLTAFAVLLIMMAAVAGYAQCLPAQCPPPLSACAPTCAPVCAPASAGVSAGVGAGPATTCVPAATAAVTPMACYPTQQLLTATVAEAWQMSGQNYSVFGDMVQRLVTIDAQKRGYNIPNTETAGHDIGALIRRRAETDPNQPLFAAVDAGLRDYARMHPEVVTR